MKRLFGKIDLTWKKVIIFACLIGIYTGIMALIPITRDTSFRDISISFEVWILFGILIIINSKSSIDSALKCFVFFLISQPLVYLVQVPFSDLGWKILDYYKNWILWTILTIPMGFIGYYMKKDKWWGLLILIPMLALLGIHYKNFLGEIIYNFPYHLLSTLFCIITIIVYPVIIFKNKKIKLTGVIIGILILIVMTFLTLANKTTYNTTILVNGGEAGAVFDDSYKVYLENSKFGTVYIEYNEAIEEFMVNAKFNRAGKTNVILEDSNGNKTVFAIDVKNDRYNITKK